MFSKDPKGAYQVHWETCPYCGYDTCEADYCDVGVGLVQCGPYYCEACGASEIGPYDKPRELTDQEEKYRWYKPGAPVSDTANTVGGTLVDHRTAKKLYDMGLLDDKE